MTASHSLESVLRKMHAEGLRTWPSVPLPFETYARFVEERLHDESDPELAAQQMKAADLYLACACAHRIPQAADAFRTHLFPEIAASIRRVDPARQFVDDVQQMVYQKAFVEADRGAPKVASYKGRGELRNWVRVIALRAAQNALRDEGKRAAPIPPILMDSVCPEHDLEASYLKQHYRDAFKAAFEAAARSLTSDQRNILRYRLQEGLPVERLAVLYKVHRVTMSRRIQEIRDTLLQRTRANLAAAVGAQNQELSSILRLVGSRLDVTLGTLVREGEKK